MGVRGLTAAAAAENDGLISASGPERQLRSASWQRRRSLCGCSNSSKFKLLDIHSLGPQAAAADTGMLSCWVPSKSPSFRPWLARALTRL